MLISRERLFRSKFWGRQSMAQAVRIGTVRIEIDGDWNIEYLRALSESLVESYGLLYPLVAAGDAVRDDLCSFIQQMFLSFDIDTRRFIEAHHFGRILYGRIPSGENLKLRSFAYPSTGFIEVGGVLSCILMLSKVARACIQAGDDLLRWGDIDKFFEDLKGRRKGGRIVLNGQMEVSSNEATKLCFAVGEKLGFDAVSCDTIIIIAANPIAALRYLVSVGVECQKLAKLQQQKLLKIPDPNGGTIIIPALKKGSCSGAGAVVVKRHRRPSKQKK
jgi:hypothetical protein